MELKARKHIPARSRVIISFTCCIDIISKTIILIEKVINPCKNSQLVLFLPALRFWKTSRPSSSSEARKSPPYAQNVARMVILLLLLAADWLQAGRSASALGLAVPIPLPGQIGLAIASVLIVTLMISTQVSAKRLTGEKLAEYQKKIDRIDLLPRKSRDWLGFVATIVLLGSGWEILYRGFLLWSLSPIVGTVAAVSIAAFAYGLAHGYHSRRHQVVNIASAFVFTIAYATTLSLWWLMVIHVALPLSAALLRSALSTNLPLAGDVALASMASRARE